MVFTSTVNLSEIANVLRTCFSIADLASILEIFYTKTNITVLNVARQDYLTAIHMPKIFHANINDCLVTYLMKKLKIKEVYTFDNDFQKFKWIKTLEK